MFGILTVMVSLLLVQAVLGNFRQFYIKGKGFMNIGYRAFSRRMVACQVLRGSGDPRGREG